MFLERYKLNLLAVPRERARCGDVYLRDGARVSSAVDITQLLDESVRLPPQFDGEPLADLAGSLSDGVSLKLGLGLLQGFLVAIGAAAVVSKVSAGYERGRSAKLRFRFAHVTRDSVDPASLSSVLEGRSFRSTQPLLQHASEYFIAAAVVRSPSISVIAEDSRARKVDLGAEVLAAVDGHAGVAFEAAGDGEVTFRGDTPLAIALELYELRYDEALGSFSMRPQAPDDHVRLGKDRTPIPVVVAPGDEALLVL
jgi:hypothetical protein